ncbi:hypothetical protein AALA21_07535 [Eggerthellaceae bacterium 3-80]|nr:hypothetical protein D7W09_07270 [bacterium D16-34]
MSEKQPTFSHITVHAEDEDDFVIQAGAKPSTANPEEAVLQAEKQKAAKQPAADAQRQSVPKTQVKSAEKPVKKPTKDDGYHETTLEDLQSSPMSSMQKVIIALALILIACAVVYCVFFMN